jgi:TolB-like protein/tetratricopeptide (TPR) repeat protein
VLRRALAWSPEDRWPDAGSFRTALAASGAPLVSAAAASATDTVPSNPRRLEALRPVSVSRPEIRPTLAVGMLCVLIAMLGVRVGVDLAERFAWPPAVQRAFYSALGLSLLLAATLTWARWVGAARVPPRLAWLASVRPNHLIGGLASVLVALVLIAAAIRSPARSAEPALDPRRIAVLYFDDHTEGEDLRHMAAGFTEALIRELSGVQSLRVLSRNAVKRYRETELPVDSIARRLSAGSLVEGSIAHSGDSIRVTVNLVDGQTGLALEGRALSRPLGELFALQDDVADEVGGFLRRRLGVEIRRREQLRETKNVAAWDLVQRAERSMDDYRPLMVGGDTAAATRVLDATDSLLAEAESRDRGWTVPPVRRGWVAQLKARLLSPIPERYEKRLAGVAMAHAERALRLKPTDPDALELRGTIRYRLAAGVADSATRGELLVGAEHDLREAVNRNPAQAGAWATLSELLQLIKAEYVQAKQAAVRAYEEDAFLDNADEILFSLAQISLDRGEYPDALRWSQEGRRRFPDMVNWPAVDLMVLVADRSGAPDVGRAWRRAAEIREMLPPQRRAYYLPIAGMQVAAVLARAGLADSARAVIARSRASFPEKPENLGYEEAYAWLMLGDRAQALRALSGYLEVAPHRRSYVAKDRLFEGLRGDPGFQALVLRGS